MNSTFSRALGAFALPLLWLALCCAGCSDRGPVGIFSKELFNRDIGLPRLDFSGASSVSFTSASGIGDGPTSVLFSTQISLVNVGVSSTYGPVLVNFSSPDTNIKFTASNNAVQAIGANQSGQEIVGNGTGAAFILTRGYQQSGQNVIVDAASSIQFWYQNPSPGVFNGTIHTVVVNMNIQDALQNTFVSQVILYVTD